MERKTDVPLTLDLNTVMEEISRITKIITGLLKFSRKGSMEFKKSNIVKELESVLVLVEKDMRLKGVEIRCGNHRCHQLTSSRLINPLKF
jgi:phosphoglycerate-specific signal transduction histidine kinase